jgi:hypothetical protein
LWEIISEPEEGGIKTVKELYLDYDDVDLDVILDDIAFFRQFQPPLKFKIFHSTPRTKRYHLKIININMPFNIAMEMIMRSHADPSYIALVKFKREFFIRSSSKYEKDDDGLTVTPAPTLVKEG